MAKLIVLFTVVPLVELWILLSIGSLIGFWPTVWIALATALLGAALAKREGRRVLSAWRDAMTRGRIPDEGITSGLLVLVGGVLLVTPGILTDLVGLALLFPPTRRRIAAAVRARVERRIQTGGAAGGGVTEGGLHDVDEPSPSAGVRGGVRWSVRVVQVGRPFDSDRPAPARVRVSGAPAEIIDVEAESVVEEDAALQQPARLPR